MLYAVIPLEKDGKFPDKARKAAKAVLDEYAPRVWFVAFDGTTAELTDLIWPDDKEDDSPIGPGIVIAINHRNGYSRMTLWEWLKAEE